MLKTVYFTSNVIALHQNNGATGNALAIEDVVKKRDFFLKENSAQIEEITNEKMDFIAPASNGNYIVFALITLSYYSK